MRVAGVDVAARRDRTVVAELEGRKLVRLRPLLPPLEYHAVMEAVRQAHAVCDLVLMDASGVGDAVYSLLHPELDRLVGARIVGGDKVKVNGRMVTVGKQCLVRLVAQTLAQSKIAVDLPPPEARLLREEMAAFEMRPGKSPGVILYEAKDGHHDDAVVAVGLALLVRALWDSGSLRDVPKLCSCGDAA